MSAQWPPQPQGVAPPAAPKQGNGKRIAIIGVLLVIIAGLATAGFLMLSSSGTDESASEAEDASYVIMDTPTVEPVFEPKDARGPDPFMSLEVQLLSWQGQEHQRQIQAVARATEDAEGQVAEVPQAKRFTVQELDAAVATGLYGGTEENTCDPERLIAFLYANPKLGEAWAQVQGIEFNEIAEFVRALEVRILANNVNVLNHGFDPTTGQAYEIDTILEAGTAVLVDSDGDIRVRCYCGNPILPKPPTNHMAPRCVLFGAGVWTTPDATTLRSNVPTSRNVVLTGRQATRGAQLWIEIKWGTESDERGWTQAGFLSKGYCPEPSDYKCPGPGDVPVWADPSETTAIGSLNGEINTAGGPVDIFAQISVPGSPGGETIIDGFVLIEFERPAPSAQNSAWVRIADLNHDDCHPVPVCIYATSPLYDRVRGAELGGAGSTFWVTFSGKFADTPASHAEVLGSPLGSGWIPTDYVPQPDDECNRGGDTPPRCLVFTHDPSDNFLWDTPAGPAPANGHAGNTLVKILDPTPQNSRIHIELYSDIDGTAPIGTADGAGARGWVAADALVGAEHECGPSEVCLIAPTAAIQSQFPDGGANLGPVPAPKIVKMHDQIGETPAGPHYLFEIDGRRGWISSTDLGASAVLRVDDPECDPPPPPEQCIPMGFEDPYRDYDPSNADIIALAAAGHMSSRVTYGDALTHDPGQETPSEPEDNPGDPGGDRPTNVCCLSGDVFDAPGGTFVRTIDPPVNMVTFGALDHGGNTYYDIGFGEWLRGIVHDSRECGLESNPACPPAQMYFNITAGYSPDDSETPYPDDDGSECCVARLWSAPHWFSPAVSVLPGLDASPVIDSVSNAGTTWYATEATGALMWFPEGGVLPDFNCHFDPCPVYPGGNALFSQTVPAITTPVSFSAGYPTISECCADRVATAPGGDTVPLDPPEWAELTGNSQVAAGMIWYEAIVGVSAVWIPESGLVGDAECEPTPPCPQGLERDNYGDCVPPETCPEDFFLSPTGECLPPCKVGDVRNAYGVCERPEPDPTVTPTPAPQPDPTVTPTPAPRPDPTVTPTPVPPLCSGEVIQGLCCEAGQVVSNDQCVDPCLFHGGDTDRDGVCDNQDNCRADPNPGQADRDGDGLGDACDKAGPCDDKGGDTDSDGVCDQEDKCPREPGATANSGCPEPTDPCANRGGDTDGDGVCNQDDECPQLYGTDMYGCPDQCADFGGDTDGDGVCDQYDSCPDTYGLDYDGCPYGNDTASSPGSVLPSPLPVA